MLISSDRILELIFVSTNKNLNPKLDIIILKKFALFLENLSASLVALLTDIAM
jgi:hypothetical protein